tara:strand:+ start:1349 stop:1681 length:333 start_codon:yes stop_codon:yes gene_type:complete
MERSMRPRSRTDNKGMSQKVTEPTTKSPDGLTIAERNKRERAAKKAKKPVAMMSGGKMPMVKKDGESVPSFAADGVGKMSYGGKTPKKMNMGGKCRGMGAATRGGNFKMG